VTGHEEKLTELKRRHSYLRKGGDAPNTEGEILHKQNGGVKYSDRPEQADTQLTAEPGRQGVNFIYASIKDGGRVPYGGGGGVVGGGGGCVGIITRRERESAADQSSWKLPLAT